MAEAVASPQAGRGAGRRDWRRSQREAPPPSITLDKVAAGLCGDLLTCVLCVWDFAREEAGKWKKPVLLVPAMNTLIWRGGGVQRQRGADPVAVFLTLGTRAGGRIRRGRGPVSARERRGRGLGEDAGQCGEEERGRACAAMRCRRLRGFSFSGGSTAAVVVADVVSAAAEVVSMLAEGSMCRVLLALTYPIIIEIILGP